MSKQTKIKLLKKKHRFFREQMASATSPAEYHYWLDEFIKTGNEMWEMMN